MTDGPTRVYQPQVRRRVLVRTALAGLGGLVVGPLLPAGRADAAPATAYGPVVTPDPIKPRIRKSGLAVGLADFSAPPRGGPSRCSTRSTTPATARTASSPTTAAASSG